MKVSKISLVYIEKRIAIRASNTFRLVGRDQIKRPAAVRTSHCCGRNRSSLTLHRFRVAQADLLKCYLLPDEYPRRIGAVIDGSESAAFPRDIRILNLFVRCELIRYLAVSRGGGRSSFFLHHHRRLRWDLAYKLAKLKSGKRWERRALRQRLKERQVETSLRLGQPSDPSV